MHASNPKFDMRSSQPPTSANRCVLIAMLGGSGIDGVRADRESNRGRMMCARILWLYAQELVLLAY